MERSRLLPAAGSLSFALAVSAAPAHAADAGALLWQDRYDASRSEQAFSVATLRDHVFVAGYVLHPTGRDFVVRAYDAASGALTWQDHVNRGQDDFASGVAAEGQRVFVSGTTVTPGRGNDWMLRAYDAATGALSWEDVFDLAGRSDDQRGTALAAGDGRVFLGGVGRNAQNATEYLVRAHDGASGALLWQDRIVGSSGAYTVAFDGGRLYVGGWIARDGLDVALVRAYDAASGALRWEHGTPGTPSTWTNSIRAEGGRVFVSQQRRATTPPFSQRPLVQAYDAETGAVLWQEEFESAAPFRRLNEIAAFGGRVFAVGGGGPACGGATSKCDAVIRAYDGAAGTVEWEHRLNLSGDHDVAELVTASRGEVFVLSQAKATHLLSGCCLVGKWVLHAFDAAHGRLLWQSVEGNLESGVYNMAVERGRLFVPGRVVSEATAEWDMVVRAYDVRARTGRVEAVFPAPSQVSGTGTAGEASYQVRFDVPVATAVHGLLAAQTQAGSVADDPTNSIGTALRTGVGVTFHAVQVPAGARHLRVALFDQEMDGAHDLDLFLFAPNGRLVSASATPGSNQTVDVPRPAVGEYTVVVHGFETDGPHASYTLFAWPLGDGAAGNLTVSGPEPATGPGAAVTVRWSGLVAGTRSLGAVSYSEGGTEVEQTLIAITP